MEILNEMKIEFLSRSSNESFARITVAAFISQLDPTLNEISDIKTAVSEAVTNAIVHGYGDSMGIIILTTRVYKNKTVEISVKDMGKGIEDIKKARQPLFTTGNSDERSGMGFTVMETFMDEVYVESDPGKGTLVVLKRCLS
ncbi:MAG: anti-sigma F factor [Ruminococcaceae bacterium]|nr:anti-sigma F factor [Oscillospiraceae bacterium]